MNRIIYFTDSKGISSGYQSAFHTIIMKVGLNVSDVMPVNIYKLVNKPLIFKQRKPKVSLDPEKRDAVIAVLDKYISAFNPALIVCSCSAILAIVAGDCSIDNHRGGNYLYKGIPVLVVFPIHTLNTRQDKKKRNLDGDEESSELEYIVRASKWVLVNDWQKISRFANGTTRYQPEFTYEVVRDLKAAKRAEKFLVNCEFISVDCETKPGFITSIQYTGLNARGEMHTYVFPFWQPFVQGGNFWNEGELTKVYLICRRINACDAIKILQNGTYDCSYFIKWHIPLTNYLIDTIHIWHCLYPELLKSLEYISSFCLDNYQYWKEDLKGISAEDPDKRDTDMEKYWRYGGLDSYYTMCDAIVLLRQLATQPWAAHNYRIEFRMAIIAEAMSMRGFRRDDNRMAEHRFALGHQSEASIKKLKIMVDDPDFNPNSWQQVQQLLYDILGAKQRRIKGAMKSTSEPALKLIRADHPIFKIFIDAIWAVKRPKKRISDFLDTKMTTSRLRTKLSPAGTETWRFNSKGSDFWDGRNQQNYPEKMRDFFLADEGFYLVDADFSQSDAVFMAYECQDPKYMDTMSSGKDTHAVHGEQFFKIPYDTIVSGKKAKDPKIVDPLTGTRNVTKRVVHGANFLMMAWTLYVTMGREAVVSAAKTLGYSDAHTWTDRQLVQLCDKFLIQFRTKMYPRLPEYYKEIEAAVRKVPAITNCYGMTRTVFGDPNDNKTQRELIAFIGQSGTAGNINRSLMELYFGYIQPSFRDAPNPHASAEPFILEQHGGQLLLQLHDSIIFQIPKAKYIDLVNNTLTVMERPCIIHGREVIVSADAKIGLRWGESMIPWDKNNPPTHEQIQETWNVKEL